MFRSATNAADILQAGNQRGAQRRSAACIQGLHLGFRVQGRRGPFAPLFSWWKQVQSPWSEASSHLVFLAQLWSTEVTPPGFCVQDIQRGALQRAAEAGPEPFLCPLWLAGGDIISLLVGAQLWGVLQQTLAAVGEPIQGGKYFSKKLCCAPSGSADRALTRALFSCLRCPADYYVCDVILFGCNSH